MTIQEQQEAINKAIGEQLLSGDLEALKATLETVSGLAGGDLTLEMTQLHTVLKNTIAKSEMLLMRLAAKDQSQPEYESTP